MTKKAVYEQPTLLEKIKYIFSPKFTLTVISEKTVSLYRYALFRKKLCFYDCITLTRTEFGYIPDSKSGNA